MSYSVTLWLVNETLKAPKYLTNLVKLVVCRNRLMVAKLYSHLNGVQGVASSNPATPTIYIKDLASQGAKSFLFGGRPNPPRVADAQIKKALDHSRAFCSFGVADGARTHDNRNHNPGLYQLSYSHRRQFQIIAWVWGTTESRCARNQSATCMQAHAHMIRKKAKGPGGPFVSEWLATASASGKGQSLLPPPRPSRARRPWNTLNRSRYRASVALM